MLAIFSSGVWKLTPEMVCCCNLIWRGHCILCLTCIFLLWIRWTCRRLIYWYRRCHIQLACLASSSTYALMVTLLLMFCVVILLNAGVFFVGLFFGFFVDLVEFAADLFVGMFDSVLCWLFLLRCRLLYRLLCWLLRWLLCCWYFLLRFYLTRTFSFFACSSASLLLML